VDLEWRRDPAADADAHARAASILDGDLTIDDAVRVAFLVNPSIQVALEQLSIPRAELVGAMTPPNPVGVIGSRKPGGDMAAFYPQRAVSIGVLMSLIELVSMPDLVAIARIELQRARYATAQVAFMHAKEVVDAWLEYCSALSVWQGFQARGEPVSGDSITAEMAAAKARTALGELMGVTGWRDDWNVAVRLPAPPASDPDPAEVEEFALKQRLDLQASARAVDARLRTLAMQRRFRWLNTLDIGLFRDKALGGTSFTGPNAVIEIPLFDQRLDQLLKADAELQIALRQYQAGQLRARTEIRNGVADLAAMRQQLQLLDGGEVDEATRSQAQLQYWRARSALAFAAGDWATISGL